MILGLLLFCGLPALLGVLFTEFFCWYRMFRGKAPSYAAALAGALSAAGSTMILIGAYQFSFDGYLHMMVFVAPPGFVTSAFVVGSYRQKSRNENHGG